MAYSTHKSVHEAERDVAEARARLESSVTELEERLNPGALVEDLVGYFQGNGRRYGRAIIREAEANPIPIVLIGVGLAWLAVGSRRSRTRTGRPVRQYDRARQSSAATGEPASLTRTPSTATGAAAAGSTGGIAAEEDARTTTGSVASPGAGSATLGAAGPTADESKNSTTGTTPASKDRKPLTGTGR